MAQDPHVFGDWITPFFFKNYGEGDCIVPVSYYFQQQKINKTKQSKKQKQTETKKNHNNKQTNKKKTQQHKTNFEKNNNNIKQTLKKTTTNKQTKKTDERIP